MNKVYIVGAGPGNPDLLTLKAYRLITSYADLIIYDRLVDKKILDLIPLEAEKIYAGKSCKKHVMTQDEINQELVDQAKKGKKVVRLKGGDPLIFGRGGEEAEFLIKNQIDFEIIPGISSASGCAAAANIPLTHRGLSNGVRFLTGHQQKGEPINHDWKGLADPDTTLVIYMGLANLEYISKNLIDAGLSEKTPACAIQQGTLDEQKIHHATLDNLEKDLKNLQFEPPTLIIIGKVAGFKINI